MFVLRGDDAIEYLAQLKIKPSAMNPIERDTPYFSTTANVVMLRNVGSHLAKIFNGNWSLLPNGDMLVLGSQTDQNLVDLAFDICFSEEALCPNDVYPGKRVEIMTLDIAICKCDPCQQTINGINGIKE